MTDFTDLVDWANEAYPIEQYETFSDWLQAVKEDFAEQDHYFPPSSSQDLASFWERMKGESIHEDTKPLTDDDIGIFDSDDAIAQEEERRRKARQPVITESRTFTTGRQPSIQPVRVRQVTEPTIDVSESTAQREPSPELPQQVDRAVTPLPARKENIVRRFIRRLFNR